MIITLEPQDGIWSEIGMHDLQAYPGGKAALLRKKEREFSRPCWKNEFYVFLMDCALKNELFSPIAAWLL